MSAAEGWQARVVSSLVGLTRFRYLKFGLVGASGTVVNIAVLYLCHEYLFQSIEGPQGKPWASLAVAIAVATVNNFTWNRLWTWADRVQAQRAAALVSEGVRAPHLGAQLLKYALASWFGIALQYTLTLGLAHLMHYMLANVIAIVIASVSNFLANDRWTFRKS
jgi:dolichol-phosphate mannosyltransferase